MEYFIRYGKGYTHIRNGENAETEYHYGEDKLIYKIVDANGGITRRQYNSFQELEVTVNPEGYTRKTAYNEFGQPVRITDENGEDTFLDYDGNRNLVSLYTPGGKRLSWDYDGLDRVVSRTTPGGETVKYAYEGGVLRTITDGQGRVYTLTFNGRYDLELLQFPNGLFRRWEYDGRGRLVLVSHLGVAEATRALAQHDRAVPVWALIFDRHAPRFKAMLEAVAPDASRHVIAVDRLGVETASMLQDAIERGEWVAIAADRTPNDALTRGDRSVTADFLGREAPFPAGPFILASLLKCGVVTLFAVREGNRILIKCEPFADEVKLPRRGREAELSRLASLWAQRLEAEALEHPAQWFNFYDFWHEEDRR